MKVQIVGLDVLLFQPTNSVGVHGGYAYHSSPELRLRLARGYHVFIAYGDMRVPHR